jgi:hypothetical protein
MYSGSELVYMCIRMGKTILIDAPQGCVGNEKPKIPLKMSTYIGICKTKKQMENWG